MMVKPTLAQDYTNFNSTCSLHVIHPQLVKWNIYFYILIYIFGLQKWNIYVDAICSAANTCCFSLVAVWLISHRPVLRRASADFLRDFQTFLPIFRHCTMPSWAVYSARVVAVEIVQFLRFSTKIVWCPLDVCKLHTSILPWMTLQNAKQVLWNFR